MGLNLVQRMAPGMLVEYERGELCRQITRVGVRCTCSQARSLCAKQLTVLEEMNSSTE